jgi:hypothetical protein
MMSLDLSLYLPLNYGLPKAHFSEYVVSVERKSKSTTPESYYLQGKFLFLQRKIPVTDFLEPH